ncbi:TetR/AcrR family transcriptional regulator [Streptomyces sp. NRRL F-5126]|uniref:TetR/AcrR family transcriptional regulator n=1 Tax=Streptomyces sp. NRRL F-5126 TaxID=1463857 RepID=UPI0004C6BBCD|nr:TetR/AcrR family transcriptional regulator [Streptomyces sp. NRRL F-5126]
MPRRSYRSTVREQAAASTRTAILDAAEALFAEHGYPRVAISSVAESAGVAQGTVYAAFGNKPALVVALMERAASDPSVEAAVSAVAAATSGGEIVALTVEGTGTIVRRHARTMDVLYGNESADPVIAGAVRRAEALQRERFAGIAARLAELGALREGLGVRDATRVLEYFVSPGSWHRLRRLGFSGKRAGEWLTDQVAHALLDQIR